MCGRIGVLNLDGVPADLKLGNLGVVVKLNENEPGNKLQRYFEKTRGGKLIMRKLLSRYVPRSISNGVKQGFSGPDASWFREYSADFVRRTLFNSDVVIYEFLDRHAVQGLVSDHLEGRENRRLLIWSLLCAEQFCKTFLTKVILRQQCQSNLRQ